MWRFLVRTTRLRELGDLLSPRFFRVFPASQISRALREILHNYRDTAGFEQATDRRAAQLANREYDIRLAPDVRPAGNTRPADGNRLLTLYFDQLFSTGPTLLDLRREKFGVEDETLVWAPLALYVDWDEKFLGGLRDIYRGFYREEPTEFDRGLDQLNLQGIGEVLLQHFGGGDQRGVTFEMDHFYESFHEVLGRCDAEGRSMHHNFAFLGLYLACLYDHLSQLGGTYDVREAFETAMSYHDPA